MATQAVAKLTTSIVYFIKLNAQYLNYRGNVLCIGVGVESSITHVSLSIAGPTMKLIAENIVFRFSFTCRKKK